MRVLVILPVLVFFSRAFVFGQVSIEGPQCVIPGITYQYNLTGTWSEQSTSKICVSGGLLAENNVACFTGPPASFVRIIWNRGIEGKIDISSDRGAASFSVNITDSLTGGKIDSVVNIQYVTVTKKALNIGCTASMGGNCNPQYLYQWQSSNDNLRWRDLKGETGENLAFTGFHKVSNYYRRKVIEKVSGTEKYSGLAIVFVNP